MSLDNVCAINSIALVGSGLLLKAVWQIIIVSLMHFRCYSLELSLYFNPGAAVAVAVAIERAEIVVTVNEITLIDTAVRHNTRSS